MSAKLLPVGCAVLIVIVALSMTFAKDDAKPTASASDRGERDFARMSAAYELAKLHWSSLEQKPVVADMFSDKLIPEQTRRWKCSMIRPDSVKPENKPDDFEKSAIDAFAAGKVDEQVLMRDDMIVRYALAVRAKHECINCHSPTGESKSLKIGDVIGVVSLTATN